MHDPAEITADLCAALVTPLIERLTFAVVHASIGLAGPRVMRYGVPVDAIDIVGQLRTGARGVPGLRGRDRRGRRLSSAGEASST